MERNQQRSKSESNLKTMIPLLLVFMIIPISAHADIMIVTDKAQYAIGEAIIINGTITEFEQGAVTLQVTAPNGNLVTIQQIPAELEFETEMSTGGPLMTSTGTYNIDVTYGDSFTGTSFEYGGTPVSNISEPVIPIITQPTLPSQDPNYLLTASTIGAPIPTGKFDSNYALALHATTMISLTLMGIVVTAVVTFALINYKVATMRMPHIPITPKSNTTTVKKVTKKKPITNLDAPL